MSRFSLPLYAFNEPLAAILPFTVCIFDIKIISFIRDRHGWMARIYISPPCRNLYITRVRFKQHSHTGRTTELSILRPVKTFINQCIDSMIRIGSRFKRLTYQVKRWRLRLFLCRNRQYARKRRTTVMKNFFIALYFLVVYCNKTFNPSATCIA